MTCLEEKADRTSVLLRSADAIRSSRSRLDDRSRAGNLCRDSNAETRNSLKPCARDGYLSESDLSGFASRGRAASDRRMLEVAARFPLLAFGIPGFASDEHLPGTQPNHRSRHEPRQEKRCQRPSVSPRQHKDPILCEPVSQPDATGFSDSEPDAVDANPSVFAKDFVAEHSSAGAAVAQGNRLISSFGSQVPAKPKSVRS